MSKTLPRQAGSSLIEVLVAVLILSFGMLALGGMMAYAVQMPKLSAYRATAMILAAGHIERMRANVAGFTSDGYKEDPPTYNANLPNVTPCTYPNCSASQLATLDKNETNQALRRELSQGGMRLLCNGACTTLEGDLWVMWQEPTTFGSFDTTNSDECPDPSATPTFPSYGAVRPRCIHVKFKL